MVKSLHHIGVLVKDVDAAVADYVQRFGYEVASETIADSVQTALVRFLRLPGQDFYIELITPDRLDSKLNRALEKGGGMNHFCYVSDDIEADCRDMRAKGMLVLHQPVPAAAFPGRRIAWLIGFDGVPVELVEPGTDEWSVSGGRGGE